jgi:hypothetical protein
MSNYLFFNSHHHHWITARLWVIRKFHASYSSHCPSAIRVHSIFRIWIFRDILQTLQYSITYSQYHAITLCRAKWIVLSSFDLFSGGNWNFISTDQQTEFVQSVRNTFWPCLWWMQSALLLLDVTMDLLWATTWRTLGISDLQLILRVVCTLAYFNK